MRRVSSYFLVVVIFIWVFGICSCNEFPRTSSLILSLLVDAECSVGTRLVTTVVLKSFGFQETAWKSWQRESRTDRASCAMTKAGSLRYELRSRSSSRLQYIVRLITDNDAKNCEVMICDSISEESVLTTEIGKDSIEADQKKLRLL